MANATALNDISNRPGQEVVLPMAVQKIYQGAAVGVILGVGDATPLNIATAGMLFQGVAEETIDNSAGAVNSVFIRVRRMGNFAFTAASADRTWIGKKVYFLDDNSVTLTPGAIEAGMVANIDSAGVVWVDIEGAVRGAATSATSNSFKITAATVTTNVAGAAQTVSTLTIPANKLKAGDKVKIRGQLIGSVRTASDTAALTLNYGATALATAICTLGGTFAHATTNWLYFDVEMVIRTSGASGTAVASGIVAAGTAGATVIGVNMASSAIDTTVAQLFCVGVTFSASNTTDAIQINIFDIEIVPS